MLVVETIAKIRRAYFSQGTAIKEICRELRVWRHCHGAPGLRRCRWPSSPRG